MNRTLRKDYPENRQQPVTVIAIVTALCLLGDSMLYIVLPIYWKEAGLTALWEVGLLLSINRFVRLPITPLIGLLYRKLPLRIGLAFAVLLASLTTIGYGVIDGFAAWLVLRCLWGIAWSFLRMGGYLAVIRYSDDSNRGHLMGRFNGISRLGSLVGMLAGGIFVPLTGMDAVSVTFGLFMLAGLPYIAVYISGSTDSTAKDADASNLRKEHGMMRKTVWTKPVFKIVAAGLLLYLILAVFTSTLSLMIETNNPQQITLFGMLVTSTMLSGVLQAARWVWEPFLATGIGRWSDGIRGRLPLFCISLIAAAAGYALLPWPIPIYVWCAVTLIVMAASTAITTLMDALASDVARHSSVIAVMTAFSVATDLGSALGPMLTYLILNLPHGMMYTYAGCAVIFVIIAIWYRPKAVLSKTAAQQTSGIPKNKSR